MIAECVPCGMCGEPKLRTEDESVPVNDRFQVKGRNVSGGPIFQNRCPPCRRLRSRQTRALSRREPDPLGDDPLMRIEPFREWIAAVLERRARLLGAAPDRGHQFCAQGAREQVAETLAADLGGTPDQWARAVYRWLNETQRIRLSTADAVLLALDFDGTVLDDLWPVEAAA